MLENVENTNEETRRVVRFVDQNHIAKHKEDSPRQNYRQADTWKCCAAAWSLARPVDVVHYPTGRSC